MAQPSDHPIFQTDFPGVLARHPGPGGPPPDRPPRYWREQFLSSGNFGFTFVVTSYETGMKYVAKLVLLPLPQYNAAGVGEVADVHQHQAIGESTSLESCRSCPFIVEHIEHNFLWMNLPDGSAQRVLMLVQEYCQMGDLQKVVTQPMPERSIGMVLFQIVSALRYLHKEQTTIHRDVTLRNVFVTLDGFCKLGDFGLCKKCETQRTLSAPQAQTRLGTLQYLAPEMWVGDRYGSKVDMWAVGVILYYLMTAKMPFEASSPDAERRDWSYALPPDTFSLELRTILHRLLTLKPSDRLSATALLQMDYMVEAEKNFRNYIEAPPISPDVNENADELNTRRTARKQKLLEAMDNQKLRLEDASEPITIDKLSRMSTNVRYYGSVDGQLYAGDAFPRLLEFDPEVGLSVIDQTNEQGKRVYEWWQVESVTVSQPSLGGEGTEASSSVFLHVKALGEIDEDDFQDVEDMYLAFDSLALAEEWRCAAVAAIRAQPSEAGW